MEIWEAVLIIINENSDAKNQLTNDKIPENIAVQHKTVGNTDFEVIAHYSGNRTYLDIVKSALLREIEKDV